jgi:methionine sulfoxide reductase heme-binding subunit
VRKFLAGKWAKVFVFLLSCVPLLVLIWRGFHNDFTANPVEFLQHQTGDWTLRFLIFTLCITPFRKVLNLPELIRFRRMLGLFAFFYVSLHFLTYLGPDQSFNLAGMLKDVVKRPFITVGFAAFVLLIPLAITSTAGWVRRLGGKRWEWLVKSDVRKPLFYGFLVGILLLWRFTEWLIKRRAAALAHTTAIRTF